MGIVGDSIEQNCGGWGWDNYSSTTKKREVEARLERRRIGVIQDIGVVSHLAYLSEMLSVTGSSPVGTARSGITVTAFEVGIDVIFSGGGTAKLAES